MKLRFRLLGVPVLASALCLSLAPSVCAQKRALLRPSPPLVAARPVGAIGGIQPINGGDTPLEELRTFSGNVDVFVQVVPHPAGGGAGVFSVSGIPAGSTILSAWLLVTSFDIFGPDVLVSANFDGNDLGSLVPAVEDFADGLFCNLYRFDVTAFVTGDGAYPYAAAGHTNNYGDALVVVYEHGSLPGRTIAIHDGAESILFSTTTTSFDCMPGAAGELLIFAEADNASDDESVRLNGATVAGPGDIFVANQGKAATLLTIPVVVQAGDNVMEIETSDDWFGVHLAILSAQAERIALDFQTEDDLATPLVNGQAVSFPGEFGQTVFVSSAGANAGSAVFDSTPLGPNTFGQDPDLLVGRGNVLMLQNSQAPMQTNPGIFDRPNDDQDGGDLVFDFPAATQPLCVTLIDIDAGSEQASSVTLLDTLGRTRTFTVPARWTEDLLADGPTAWRELDLTRLDPQPGFQSIATAVQSPGFDATSVVRMIVHLGSSGAVDDLVYAP